MYMSATDSKNGSFTYPRTFPLTFNDDSLVNVTWSTTFESVLIAIYQQGNKKPSGLFRKHAISDSVTLLNHHSQKRDMARMDCLFIMLPKCYRP